MMNKVIACAFGSANQCRQWCTITSIIVKQQMDDIIPVLGTHRGIYHFVITRSLTLCDGCCIYHIATNWNVGVVQAFCIGKISFHQLGAMTLCIYHTMYLNADNVNLLWSQIQDVHVILIYVAWMNAMADIQYFVITICYQIRKSQSNNHKGNILNWNLWFLYFE